MDARKITDSLSVAPQLTAPDVAKAARAGFRAIICNRPDGEGADQPAFDEIEAEAKKHGLQTAYLPVVSGNLQDADVRDFGTALTALPGPVLAYCRSGTRSATLWALSETGKRPLPDILAATEQAGYDMTGVVERFAARQT